MGGRPNHSVFKSMGNQRFSQLQFSIQADPSQFPPSRAQSLSSLLAPPLSPELTPPWGQVPASVPTPQFGTARFIIDTSVLMSLLFLAPVLVLRPRPRSSSAFSWRNDEQPTETQQSSVREKKTLPEAKIQTKKKPLISCQAREDFSPREPPWRTGGQYGRTPLDYQSGTDSEYQWGRSGPCHATPCHGSWDG